MTDLVYDIRPLVVGVLLLGAGIALAYASTNYPPLYQVSSGLEMIASALMTLSIMQIVVALRAINRSRRM